MMVAALEVAALRVGTSQRLVWRKERELPTALGALHHGIKFIADRLHRDALETLGLSHDEKFNLQPRPFQ